MMHAIKSEGANRNYLMSKLWVLVQILYGFACVCFKASNLTPRACAYSDSLLVLHTKG